MQDKFTDAVEQVMTNQKKQAMFKASIKDRAKEADNIMMRGGHNFKKKVKENFSKNFPAKLRSIYKTENNYKLAKKVFVPAIKRLR